VDDKLFIFLMLAADNTSNGQCTAWFRRLQSTCLPAGVCNQDPKAQKGRICPLASVNWELLRPRQAVFRKTDYFDTHRASHHLSQNGAKFLLNQEKVKVRPAPKRWGQVGVSTRQAWLFTLDDLQISPRRIAWITASSRFRVFSF